MAIKVRVLGANFVQAANTQEEGYAVPSGVLGAIVNNIRLANDHASTTATVNVYIKKGSDTSVRILDLNKQLPPNGYLIIKPEINLEPDHKIMIESSLASSRVTYVICGAEKIS